VRPARNRAARPRRDDREPDDGRLFPANDNRLYSNYIDQHGLATEHNGWIDTNDNAVTNFFAEDETRAGGNIGVGVVGFAGNWGFRGDIRYFHAFDQEDNGSNGTSGSTTTSSGSSNESLPGLNFWRANIGVAFGW
jgi:hypothetical protein